jgi:hypothetical protein
LGASVSDVDGFESLEDVNDLAGECVLGRYRIVPISRQRRAWKLGRERGFPDLAPALAKAEVLALVYGGCVVLDDDAPGVREPFVLARLGSVPMYWL